MMASCSPSEVRSQVSIDHPDLAGSPGRSRRPSRPGRRSRLHPELLREQVGVLRLEVVGAVLEADQVARRGLRPATWTTYGRSRAATSAPRTTPKPIRARLRIACTATCGSFAHAWTQMSPPDRVGSQVVAGKCGRSARAVGRLAARPNRSCRRRTATRRSRWSASAGTAADRAPRRCRPAAPRPAPPTAPYRPASRPAVIRAAAAVHSFSSSIRSSRFVVMTSNATKCSRSWAGVTMPGLVLAVERRPAAFGVRGRRDVPHPTAPSDRGARPRRRPLPRRRPPTSTCRREHSPCPGSFLRDHSRRPC